MKMSAEHFATLSEAVALFDTEQVREAFRNGEFPRADRVTDLNKRYRWDLYWAAKPWRLFDTSTYHYRHIDTALRRIVSPL